MQQHTILFTNTETSQEFCSFSVLKTWASLVALHMVSLKPPFDWGEPISSRSYTRSCAGVNPQPLPLRLISWRLNRRIPYLQKLLGLEYIFCCKISMLAFGKPAMIWVCSCSSLFAFNPRNLYESIVYESINEFYFILKCTHEKYHKYAKKNEIKVSWSQRSE